MTGAVKFDLTNAIYNDPDAARTHLEQQLWPEGPVCPHCASTDATALEGKAHRKGLYQCNNCREQFSVTVGTVFERSKIGLHKWVLAAHLMAASKKGMSAKQIQRMLGVTYKTSWFMMHRLREAMSPEPIKDSGHLGGAGKVIEADETYVGGKARNAHNNKPVPKKHAVVALVERDGKAYAKHVPNVTSKNVREVLVTNASRKSKLNTDDSLLYYWLGREFAEHGSVNHSASEYVSKDGKTHTQTVESFFAILKRGITGSFHSVSEQHLQRYIDEFSFRWNHRSALGVEDFDRANALVKGAAGKRLTYRRPNKAANDQEKVQSFSAGERHVVYEHRPRSAPWGPWRSDQCWCSRCWLRCLADRSEATFSTRRRRSCFQCSGRRVRVRWNRTSRQSHSARNGPINLGCPHVG